MTFLHIVGTSHIAKKAQKDIKQAVLKHNPDIITVELDPERLYALQNKNKPNYSPLLIRKVGFLGYIFAVVGSIIQRKLGSFVGVQPGAEMLYATKIAQEEKKQLALIDQPLHTTLSRLSKKVPFREKMRLAGDLIKGLVFRKRKVMKISLDETPEQELVVTLLKYMKERYPFLHKVLVEERNTYMARNIIKIHEKNPDKIILAVLGAGHVPHFQEELNSIQRRRDQVTKPI